jgi:hypothetical protein
MCKISSIKTLIINAPPHTTDKLQLAGQNLGQVFNFRFGHLHAAHFWCYQLKLPNLKLKTRPKQLLGSLPLVIMLPACTLKIIHMLAPPPPNTFPIFMFDVNLIESHHSSLKL